LGELLNNYNMMTKEKEIENKYIKTVRNLRKIYEIK